jgi:hypothetical protein
MSRTVVGIDFDNTIAVYDGLFHELAVSRALVDADVPRTKRDVRDAVRLLDSGDRHWQELQASAYGTHMAAATPAPGVAAFLARCRGQGVPVYIVSHRTSRAAANPDVDLREAARAWLRAQALVGPAGVAEDHVFFEGSRAEKLARIQAVGCTHFIDDLEEVLREPAFPSGVVKILYAPHGGAAVASTCGIRAVASWAELLEAVLGCPC